MIKIINKKVHPESYDLFPQDDILSIPSQNLLLMYILMNIYTGCRLRVRLQAHPATTSRFLCIKIIDCNVKSPGAHVTSSFFCVFLPPANEVVGR